MQSYLTSAAIVDDLSAGPAQRTKIFFFIINMQRRAIISSKNENIFAHLSFDHANVTGHQIQYHNSSIQLRGIRKFCPLVGVPIVGRRNSSICNL